MARPTRRNPILGGSQTPDPEEGERPQYRQQWRSRLTIASSAAIVIAIVGVVGFVVPGLFGGWQRGEGPGLDRYRESDVEFFRQFRVTAADPVTESYGTLEAAAQSVSGVISAKVRDVRVGHTVGPPTDEFYTIYLVLDPTEVLVGRIPERYRDELIISFVAGPDKPSKKVERLRSSLPEGQSVWFLRSAAEVYEQLDDLREQGETRQLPEYAVEQRNAEEKTYLVISNDAMFVQGPNGVTTPLKRGHESSDGGQMAEVGMGYERLSGLVEYLRSVDGWHGNRPSPWTDQGALESSGREHNTHE